MPSDVRMVPTSVIVGLLLTYVAVIGPLDYWILGWFRIRKYTWVMFPLMTLLFTLLMIAVAHHYLGANETGGRFTVTDVVDDGRPVRSSAIDLQFVGSRREITPSIQSGLISWPRSEPLSLIGRFPNEYSVSRRIEQWSPEVIRTFTLTADAIPDLSFDWNDTRLVTTKHGRQELRRALVENSSYVVSRRP